MQVLFTCGDRHFRAVSFLDAVKAAIAAGIPADQVKQGEFFALQKLGEDSKAAEMLERL